MEQLYILKWNSEVIEEGLTKKEAEYLQKEYNMAYRGGVTMRREK